ncbi:MAG: hypothetical protein K2W85_07705 [Phycisphaerales bacterium]|nr:hypothetical protein [Phycisphaerales bacterium]
MLIASLLVLALSVAARGAADDAWPRAVAAFDAAANAVARGEGQGKDRSRVAAEQFREIAERAMTDHARASALYNAGAAYQLAGDAPKAVLALSRANILHPAIPGLSKRLAASRAAARGETVPQNEAASPIGERLAAMAWSVRAVVLWSAVLISWCVIWVMVFVRLAIPAVSRFRLVLIIGGAAMLFVVSGSWLGAHEWRKFKAQSQAIVLIETTPRDQPDELVGQPTNSALRPGIEVSILEARVGSDGRRWIRCAPIDLVAGEIARPLWIPETTIERLLPPQPAASMPPS